MNDSVIEARGLTKRYGGVAAVNCVDLDVHRGEVFGLLGPNGAGKTTTILMLLGLTDVSAGTVRVLGLDPAREPLRVKRRIGYMPDAVGFYGHLTAQDNLRYTGRLAGLEPSHLETRMREVLAQVGLTPSADARVSTFSNGMRRRLGLADVLLKEPEVVILDEPTNGLDPSATREFLDLVRELKQRGITILLSSHLLERVQCVCDRVALFHRGQIALEGTVAELAAQVLGSGYRIVLEVSGPEISSTLLSIPKVVAVDAQGDGRYRLEATSDVRSKVAAIAINTGCEVKSLVLIEPSLSEIYAQFFEGLQDAA